MRISKEYFRGCLLGGAIGDALGWPVEFLTKDQIKEEYGENGIIDLVIGKNGKAEITDDTQMTLFTAEGLLTALEGGIDTNILDYVYNSYLSWLHTQGVRVSSNILRTSWLLEIEELYATRAPGTTCLTALKSGIMGRLETHINNSKGCGGVMRVAPIGLMFEGKESFDLACRCAAITHGHPSGYISAGILACIIAEIVAGNDIEDAIDIAVNMAKKYIGHEECTEAIERALELAEVDILPEVAIKTLGEGWVGEEALAIAIYCCLKYKDDFKTAIITAVNHDGDSDSTGAITGNILGAYMGINKIPTEWVKDLELKEVIVEISDDIYRCRTMKL